MNHIKRIVLGFCVFPIVLLFSFSGKLSAILDPERNQIRPGDVAQVIAVYDGDTLKVRFENGKAQKARLIGIDAPEIGDEREKVSFLAYTAKRFVFFHLFRKRVRIEFDWERTDKYGRLLVYVWTEGQGLFNEFILKEGYASAFTKFPFDEMYKKRFIAAERYARNQEKGLWKSEPLFTITETDTLNHVGEFLSVKFLCANVRTRGNFVFLNSSGKFSALIPRARIAFFPNISQFEGRIITVKGFLETYNGKPQIMVFLPLQFSTINK